MPTPASRTPVRIGRGLKADLVASIADLQEGEIVWAEDENAIYVVEGSGLAAQLVPAQIAPAAVVAAGGLIAGNGVSSNLAREVLAIDTGTF